MDLRLKYSSIRYGNTHSIRINRNPLLLVARTDFIMQFVKKSLQITQSTMQFVKNFLCDMIYFF